MDDENESKFCKDKNSTKDSLIESSNIATQRFLPNHELFDIYNSPYLNKMFKPTFKSLNLTQELEPLAQLFMLQCEDIHRVNLP